VKDIEEITMLMKEAKGFYIVNDISNCEDFGKHLFERAYKEIGYNNDYVRNYMDDTKIFIENEIYGYTKMKEQNGTVKDKKYIAYFGNEERLEKKLKNIGINMIKEKEQEEIKLYMPLKITTYREGEEGYEEEEEIYKAYKYKEEICKALGDEKQEEEETRGLFTYYKEKDRLDAKVAYWHFEIEEIEEELIGVAVVKLRKELKEEDMIKLKADITGQASDGFGESFEQQGIKVIYEDKEVDINVSFWNDSYKWGLKTEEEMGFRNHSQNNKMKM